MERIGISISTNIILNEPKVEAEERIIKEYGSTGNLFASLRNAGVTSIEILNARDSLQNCDSDTLAAVRMIHNAGFEVTIHIEFDGTTGKEYAARMRKILLEAVNGQGKTAFTVHPVESFERTAELYADWSKVFTELDERCMLTLENMRYKKVPGTEYVRLNSVYDAVLPVKGQLTWDMGHYTYNVLTSDLSIETLPEAEYLALMKHTHIHGIIYPKLTTHFPLTTENKHIELYVKALKNSGYQGVYNLELGPERWLDRYSPRESFENSIAYLREMLK